MVRICAALSPARPPPTTATSHEPAPCSGGCEGPRSAADYIEIARCYGTLFLSGVPALGPAQDDAARRFVTLVDELYDRGVKLVVSAESDAPEGLYRGERLAFEFRRTASRLHEMRSRAYLAKPHRP